jgi:hypothetical protein
LSWHATSGVKTVVSTALGTTDTRVGLRLARRTWNQKGSGVRRPEPVRSRSTPHGGRRAVFSLLVWETQTTWSVVDSVNSSSLFVMIEEASAKPKSCQHSIIYIYYRRYKHCDHYKQPGLRGWDGMG